MVIKFINSKESLESQLLMIKNSKGNSGMINGYRATVSICTPACYKVCEYCKFGNFRAK